MKEIIVIKDKEVSKVCEDCGEYGDGCIMKENCKNKNTYGQAECCFNFRFTPKFKVEQVPTNWEELKELCIKDFRLNTSKNINNNRRYIVCCAMNFYENGFIEDSEGIIIAQRTPQQMWQIIKNLIGEE